VRILEQVSGALAEAHEIGIIHRDVKPANIILCERGGLPDVAKVVDFGLVKPIDKGASEATMPVTAAGMIVGTPLYMAPEAISGEPDVDGRSDLYALGAVGYFLLTGSPVFRARTIVEVCAHHLHTEPEPPSRRAGREFPADLERIILQCLAKSPADRPRSARSLQRALAGCASDAPWSMDEAARWWVAFRQTHAPTAAIPAARPAQATAVVDLDDRLPTWN
jgi:serine/threonine-protein kinase